MVGAYVFLAFVLRFRKTPEKSQPGKLTRPGIEPGPPRCGVMMSPLDYSGDLFLLNFRLNRKTGLKIVSRGTKILHTHTHRERERERERERHTHTQIKLYNLALP